MKQKEIARKLGISKSYLSMIISGKREIPEHLEGQISELCEQKQLQSVPSKQRVVGSNPSRDASFQPQVSFLHSICNSFIGHLLNFSHRSTLLSTNIV
ncbi:helix-turn-helix domain-containing protein [Chloroflexota bacterium]